MSDYVPTHTMPFKRDGLNPRVFSSFDNGRDPILVDGIKNQILNDINQLNQVEDNFNNTRVADYIVTGAILKEGASNTAPIIVYVKINTNNLTDILKERLLNKVKEISGKKAVLTLNTINYVLTIRDFDIDNMYAAYHPFSEKWLKKPLYLGK
jgi:hypothetical protein